VSLQTLRSDIDYHVTTAATKYGVLGIKVWISRGDITTRTAPKTQPSATEDKKKAMEKVLS
jgi:small subunit ribosomal protein S3